MSNMILATSNNVKTAGRIVYVDVTDVRSGEMKYAPYSPTHNYQGVVRLSADAHAEFGRSTFDAEAGIRSNWDHQKPPWYYVQENVMGKPVNVLKRNGTEFADIGSIRLRKGDGSRRRTVTLESPNRYTFLKGQWYGLLVRMNFSDVPESTAHFRLEIEEV